MQWGPGGAEPLAVPSGESDPRSASLRVAELDAVVADIVAVVDEVQPTAIVSYDERGGYGHPDHIRAHEAASVAARETRVPFYSIVPAGQELPEDIRVDVSAVLELKKRALRAHRTQLSVNGDTIVHSGGQREPISTVEIFRPQRTHRSPGADWAQLGVLVRIAACLIAVALGGIIGAIGTANYQVTGAIASLAISAALLAGLRLLFATRIVAAFAALGLLGVVWVFSQTGPGGSVLVPANLAGFVWAYGPLIIAFLVLAWPQPGTFTRATMGTGSDLGKDVEAL
jgi:N-acetyl-1-D-myo-inositol-2-amino-2-deoxy-alpha-D-glucopyranoside deacetylase